MTNELKPCRGAAEALDEMLSSCGSVLDPYTILSYLSNQGYTITRAAAPSGELAEAVQYWEPHAAEGSNDWRHWNVIKSALSELEALRAKPKMSEAELLNQIEEVIYSDEISGADDTHLQALALIARKYAGEDV